MSNLMSKTKDHIQIHDATYRIISKMTHGGMGEIYLVQNVASGKFYALKHFFSHAFSCQEDCEEYWRREQEIMRIQSRSPVRAVQFIDAFTLPSNTGEIEYYLLMEYVQGITLEEWIKQHPDIPDQPEIHQRLSQIIIPLCRHLEYVHLQGIVHRDITPRNVMLIIEQNNLIPVLIDWGVAKQQTLSQISRSSASATATTIASIGNPPEVLAGFEPVIASDVYMVGFLTYYLLSGGLIARPFKEHDYPLQLASINPNVASPIYELICQMTQYESQNRIQSMSEVITILQTTIPSEGFTFVGSGAYKPPSIPLSATTSIPPSRSIKASGSLPKPLMKSYRGDLLIATEAAVLETFNRWPGPVPKIHSTTGHNFGYTSHDGHVISLILINQNLHFLPENFGTLTLLETLDLSQNQLSFLPSNFGNLTSLKHLNLMQNLLSSLPANIGNLSSLISLDLRWNPLTSLPESFAALISLEELKIEEIPMLSLPQTIKKFLKTFKKHG